MTADLILKNLHAITFARQDGPAELIAAKGNKILYVGAADALGYMKGPHTRVLDCDGGFVAPGFNDAHCHALAFAITLRYVDCSKARCIADIQAVLREKVCDIKGDQWVRAAHCDFSALSEGRAPDRRELDAVVSDLPVLLLERSGQHCVLNSRALELCGITGSTFDSASGSIHRDPVTGLPNGLVSGNNDLVAKAIPPLTEREIEAGMRQANKEYLSLGITSIQDTSWSNGYRHWLAMKGFKHNGVLVPRLTLLPGVDAMGEFAERGLKTGSGDDHMRVGAVKIALDESTGNPCPSQEDISHIALKTHLAGFQIAFHVHDVYPLQASMRALEFIRKHAASACVRPRFEHCPVCPPALVPELAASGAIVITQPNLFHETGPRYLKELSSKQLTWVYPLRSFVQHGIPLAFSSDSPLTPCNPFLAIHAAVTRTVAGGAVLSPDESISAMEALKMYTYFGAYSSNEEHIKGSIAVGMLADLAVLNGDPMRMSPEGLIAVKTMATVIDGKVAWER